MTIDNYADARIRNENFVSIDVRNPTVKLYITSDCKIENRISLISCIV